jgi:hypothetical protein
MDSTGEERNEMATAQAPGTSSWPSPVRTHGDTQSTAWVGWVFFAGIMMILLGIFEAITALVALFNDKYYLVGPSGLVVSVDYTAWGWVHLFLGLVALGAGIGVIFGKTWARVVGIVFAVFSAIVNLAFIPAYPLWSMLVIALDVIVIYALAVHGAETKAMGR